MPSEFVEERLRRRGWLRTAHRGAPRYAPDNSAESIRIAAGFAVDLVEIDVHLSRDGRLVLWHDETIRAGGKAHAIGALTLAQLRALPDQGNLATLEEAIELVRGKAGLMVDLKAAGLELPLMDCFERLNFFDVCVCGGYKATLAHLRDRLPQVSVSLTPEPLERIDFARWDAVTVHWRMVGPKFVEQAHRHGTRVLAWTVDEPEVARRLLELGADGVTSNDVDMLCGL